MRLERFSKNKKQKRIVIASIVGILLIVGGITLYRTFALYEEKLEFNVLKGRIPDFSSGDIELAMTLDGEGITEIPSDRNYTVTVTCDTEEMSGTWNYENWTVTVSGAITKPTKCSIDFSSIFKYYIDEEEVKEKPDKSIYLYKNMTCTSGTATYNEETQEGTVTSYEEGMECSIKYKTPSTTLFSDYLIAKSITDSSIIRQEHEETEQTGANATIDYRYIGKNPNNYVCLEASGNCTEDQLYRIIGVIPTQSSEDGPYENRVKLIKATYYKNVYWSGSKESDSTDWTKSSLNTEVLNETYWNSISNYQKYIDNTKWYIGGNSYDKNLMQGTTMYKNERGNLGGYSCKDTFCTITKIGLIYPSDYGYATSGSDDTDRVACFSSSLASWSEEVSLKGCSKNNWLNDLNVSIGSMWTITPVSVWKNAFFVRIDSSDGDLSSVGVSFNTGRAYPVFHLNAKVRFSSGDGARSNPYRVEL